MDLYLITGFLGAGKTTFLQNFIKQFADKKIFLLINEFGKAGVDGALLNTLDATLAEINNGSIFCSCRLDKFEETLISAMQTKPEIILVEASGLSDPTNVRKILAMQKFNGINYCGCVCIADSLRLKKVINTAIVCKKQLLVASLTLINKSDLATAEKITECEETIHNINPYTKVKQTCFGNFEAQWLKDIKPCSVSDEPIHTADITLQSASVKIKHDMPLEALRHFLNQVCEDTYRIKGFVKLGNDVYLANCVGGMVELNIYTENCTGEIGTLVFLSGKGMPLRKTLKSAIALYENYIVDLKL